MRTKKKSEVIPQLIAKAKQVLEFAERKANKVATRTELSNALFATDGKASLAFPTEAERNAFCKTKEYKSILKLMNALPWPPVKEVVIRVKSLADFR
jgi:hypothetical protein